MEEFTKYKPFSCIKLYYSIITVSFWVYLHIHVNRSPVGSKLKVKVMKNLISIGIDHSNPYIHSTTVLCDMYKKFEKEVICKRYLCGVGDAGTRLLFKFRSGHMA